jgi:hemerythrin
MADNPFKRRSQYFWKPEYTVKVKLLDDQHKTLIELMNQAADLVDLDGPPYKVGLVLDSMNHYAILHFSTEERLMNQCLYPGLEGHKKEHEYFFKEVSRFRKLYNEGESSIYREMAEFLRSWFIAHIQKLDTKYSEMMNMSGIR